MLYSIILTHTTSDLVQKYQRNRSDEIKHSVTASCVNECGNES